MTPSLRFLSASLLALQSVAIFACGGSTGNAQEASANTESESYGAEGENGEMSTAPARGPDCSDGTCFACGEGICPTGAHCDQDATGGPACAWLPECTGTSTCACVTSVVGSSCSCDDSGGGPIVSCQ